MSGGSTSAGTCSCCFSTWGSRGIIFSSCQKLLLRTSAIILGLRRLLFLHRLIYLSLELSFHSLISVLIHCFLKQPCPYHACDLSRLKVVARACLQQYPFVGIRVVLSFGLPSCTKTFGVDEDFASFMSNILGSITFCPMVLPFGILRCPLLILCQLHLYYLFGPGSSPWGLLCLRVCLLPH